MGIGAGIAIIGIAAAADLASLERHVRSGPFMFTGADCAGAAPAAGAPAPQDPTIGLSAWASFAGSTLHDPVIPASPLPGDAFTASWTFQTNGSVVMAPSVVDGVAYAGSMDGCVYAIDVSSGRLLWSFAADNQVMSQPIAVNGQVIFGSGNKGMGRLPSGEIVRGTGESGVYALDAATGQEEWFVQTLGEDMPTPAEQDGIVYEATGGQVFYAISAATGKLLWDINVGAYVSMSSPTLSGDIAVFGGARPYALIGVNVQTHEVAWRLALPEAPGGVDDITPAVSGGVAYVQVPEGRKATRIVEMAVRTSDGQVLWQRTLGTDRLNLLQRALGRGELGARDGEETGVATVSGGVLYTGTPALSGLWALSAATGQPVWSRPARTGQPIRTAPVVSGNRIYATGNNDLLMLEAASGKVLTRTKLGTFQEGTGIMIPCTTPSPVLLGSTLLVGAGDDSSAIAALPVGATA